MASARSLLALVSMIAVGCGAPTRANRAADATWEPPEREEQIMEWSPKDADAGIESPGLRELLRTHWAFSMSQFPVWATQLGIHRFDDRIADGSAEAIAARDDRAIGFLRQARELPTASLTSSDRRTLAVLIDQLETEIMVSKCQFQQWSVSTYQNPVSRFGSLPDVHAVVEPPDGDNLVRRYAEIPKAVADEIDNLRVGHEQGLHQGGPTLDRVIALVERELAKPTSSWALMKPVKEVPEEWTQEQKAAFSRSMSTVVDTEVRAAFVRYLAFLRDELRPSARQEEGLSALPMGAVCYEALIREHVTQARSPQEIHEIGLREIDRIDAALTTLGKQVLGAGSLAEVLNKLRTDPKLYFQDEAEIVAAAETALAKAKARMPDLFDTLPKADCVVERIPDFEAPFTTIAYYRGPIPGEKPGQYFINVHEPQTRPRFEAEVLAYHESIPGHHLQIAIAQELGALPAFRKHSGVNAYLEGWALYTERLADEVGLYSTDLDRFGMLSFDAWRAARLVVDTGIHHHGWSRERAEAFMLAHTALSKSNIHNEVDRYIGWPGQALSYKLGQMEILALRSRAQQELGSKFRLPAFHDAILTAGAVPLPILQQVIDEWIAAEKTSAGP